MPFFFQLKYKKINLDFEYYEEIITISGKKYTIYHKRLFHDQLKYKLGEIPKKLISIEKRKEFTISFQDFIIYSLYKHKNENIQSYKDYTSIRKTAKKRKNDFLSYYELGNSIKVNLESSEGGADRTYSEYQGTAGSLTFNNLIFGLTNADYAKVKESNIRKTLDYNIAIASTGTKFVMIECKGTTNGNNRKSSADHIIQKKLDCDYIQDTDTIYYGLIIDLPYKDKNRNAKATLVDPLFQELNIDPLFFKIVMRLIYYYNKMSLIAETELVSDIGLLLNKIIDDGKNWLKTYSDNIAALNLVYKPFGFNYKCSYIDVPGYGDCIGRAVKLNGDIFYYGILKEVFIKFQNPTIDYITSINFKKKSDIKIYATLKVAELKDLNNINKFDVFGSLSVYETGEVIGFFKQEE